MTRREGKVAEGGECENEGQEGENAERKDEDEGE